MEPTPELIICKRLQDLPKTPLWSSGKCKDLAEAVAIHAARGRKMPPVIYVWRSEYFFPVVDVNASTRR